MAIAYQQRIGELVTFAFEMRNVEDGIGTIVSLKMFTKIKL